MDVVDVDGRVAQAGAVRQHGAGELLQYIHSVRVLHELLLEVPEIVPAHLHPVVAALRVREKE